MSVSRSLSAAEQHNLLSLSMTMATRLAHTFDAKHGFHNFFTKEDIEDLSSEVVMKAWRSIDRFDPEKGKFNKWLLAIAANCLKNAVDYKIKRAAINDSMYVDKDEELEERDSAEYFDDFSDNDNLYSEYDAESSVNMRDINDCINGTVGAMNERNRRVYDMMNAGYSPKEIALAEGCTSNAASIRIHNIREALKAALADVAMEFGIAC